MSLDVLPEGQRIERPSVTGVLKEDRSVLLINLL